MASALLLLLQPVGIRIRSGDGGCSVAVEESIKMIEADGTRPDYRATESLMHRRRKSRLVVARLWQTCKQTGDQWSIRNH